MLLLAAVIVFFIVSAVISAVVATLHFLFWIGLVLVVIFGTLALSHRMRRSERR
jgi:arginine exporter protein ArgO